DIKVVEHKYGNVVWIQDNLGKDYVAHTWVKRDKGGWKLLQTSEISVHARDYTAVRPNYAVPCINPCEYVPYKPQTENEKASLVGSGHCGGDDLCTAHLRRTRLLGQSRLCAAQRHLDDDGELSHLCRRRSGHDRRAARSIERSQRPEDDQPALTGSAPVMMSGA